MTPKRLRWVVECSMLQLRNALVVSPRLAACEVIVEIIKGESSAAVDVIETLPLARFTECVVNREDVVMAPRLPTLALYKLERARVTNMRKVKKLACRFLHDIGHGAR